MRFYEPLAPFLKDKIGTGVCVWTEEGKAWRVSWEWRVGSEKED